MSTNGQASLVPFGAYGWLEDALDLPITSALADVLTSGTGAW